MNPLRILLIQKFKEIERVQTLQMERIYSYSKQLWCREAIKNQWSDSLQQTNMKMDLTWIENRMAALNDWMSTDDTLNGPTL